LNNLLVYTTIHYRYSGRISARDLSGIRYAAVVEGGPGYLRLIITGNVPLEVNPLKGKIPNHKNVSMPSMTCSEQKSLSNKPKNISCVHSELMMMYVCMSEGGP
jgi:hypothetical protein